MKLIGAHVSINGGVCNAITNALDIEANTFSMFIKNPRSWAIECIEDKKVEDKFKDLLKKHKFLTEHILPHSSYLINIGSPNIENREKSIISLINESKICNRLGLKFINIHPGNGLNIIDSIDCLNIISKNIEHILMSTENIIIVLENTAGQGGCLGYDFKQIKYIIDSVDKSLKNRLGICIDTCHAFSAGYMINDKQEYNKLIKYIEDHIGIDLLKGIHMNDSKYQLGSRKDRHENIGKGFIGIDCFKWIVNDERFNNIPLLLETDKKLWKDEIKMLRSMIKT